MALDVHVQQKVLAALTPYELARAACVSRPFAQLVRGLRAPHPAALTHAPLALRAGLPDFAGLLEPRQQIERSLAERLDPMNICNPLACAEAGANLLPENGLTRANALQPQQWLELAQLPEHPVPASHAAQRAIVAFAQASRPWQTSDVGCASIAMALSVTHQADAVHYAQQLLQLWRASPPGSPEQTRRSALLGWVCKRLVAADFMEALLANPPTQGLVDPCSLLASAAADGSLAQARLASAALAHAAPPDQQAAATAAWEAYARDGVITADTVAILQQVQQLGVPGEPFVLEAAQARNLAAIEQLHTMGVRLPDVSAALQQSHVCQRRVELAHLWLKLEAPVSQEAARALLVLALQQGDAKLVDGAVRSLRSIPRLRADEPYQFLETCLRKGTRQTLAWLWREQPHLVAARDASWYRTCIASQLNAETFAFLREQGVPLSATEARALVDVAIQAHRSLQGSWSYDQTGRESAEHLFPIVEQLQREFGLDFAHEEAFTQTAIETGGPAAVRWFAQRYAKSFSVGVLEAAVASGDVAAVELLLQHGVDDAQVDAATQGRLLKKALSAGNAHRVARKIYDLLVQRGYQDDEAATMLREAEALRTAVESTCRVM